MTKTRLIVGNLPKDANEALLRLAFENEGRRVQSVALVTDEATGRFLGRAYVDMASEEDLQAAIAALDGSDLDGRTLVVHAAERED